MAMKTIDCQHALFRKIHPGFVQTLEVRSDASVLACPAGVDADQIGLHKQLDTAGSQVKEGWPMGMIGCTCSEGLLLTSTLGGSGHKHAKRLAMQFAFLPERSSAVPKLLELPGYIAKPVAKSISLSNCMT